MGLISDKDVKQFREQGYFVTEPMWDRPQLRELAGEFHRLHQEMIKKAEAGGDPKYIQIARLRPFIGAVHTQTPVAARFVMSPIYLEACQKLLGDDADLYFNQAVLKPPEKGMSFAWHQDSGYRVTKPLEYITCWTAITRSFIENGCIWIIPGSHKHGLIKHNRDNNTMETIAEVASEKDAIPVEMEPGRVAIFSSLMLHKSGPNTSGEVRVGYVPQYSHPNMAFDDTGELTGDLYPVLRGGKPVKHD